MGTGRYALGLNFKGAAPPTEASPIVAVPNGNPQHASGGQADGSDGNEPYGIANPVITGISPDNGVSSQDGVTNNPKISIFGHGAVPIRSPSTSTAWRSARRSPCRTTPGRSITRRTR